MWVVKLGGSLLGTPELKHWLQLFADKGDGKVVIVPGGGLFADAVRLAQQRSHIDDRLAHRLAVMAMDQYGLLLAGLNPGLATASSELEIAERGWQHRGIIWLPSAMVCADEQIPQDWGVSSDSLAAWLASKLNAAHLLLVKSELPVKSDSNMALQASVQDLQRIGMLDTRFHEFIQHQSFGTWLLSKSDYRNFIGNISHTLSPPCATEVLPLQQQSSVVNTTPSI